jgi:hypothetical protein
MSVARFLGSRGDGGRRRALGVGAVLAFGMLLLLLAGVVALLQRAPRRSGTNLTADAGYVIELAPSQHLCEPGELLPGDTGALKLDVATEAGSRVPPLIATLDGPTGRLATGRLRGGEPAGMILLPVEPVVRRTQGGTVCIRNLGTVSVRFGGSVPDQAFVIEVAGKPLLGRMRVEYMRPGRESWFGLLPTLAYRFSLAKSDLVRHWEVWAVLVLMLTSLALAARTLIRDERVG